MGNTDNSKHDLWDWCRSAIFKCAACGEEALRYNMGGTIEDPTKCPRATCGKPFTMQLMHNYGEYNNKQLIKMQASVERPSMIFCMSSHNFTLPSNNHYYFIHLQNTVTTYGSSSTIH